MQLKDIAQEPNILSAHYKHFRVSERLLLTGHSHQAWPDCALEGQIQAFTDAAMHLDEKWGRAFAVADQVRSGFARMLGDDHGKIALSASTHDLVVRFLSALPLRTRPRLVTTDGEFHSIRRQLTRLEEEGIEVVRVASDDPNTIAERMAAEVDDRTSAVLVSHVLFKSGRIVPNLHHIAEACEHRGVKLMVDVYHSLNVVPLSLSSAGLMQAYVIGGGYKYCQMGEGNCFMRIPADCDLRPVITGWFAELMETLAGHSVQKTATQYPNTGDRFAGATYDPTAHYRAAKVLDFFNQYDLGANFLRTVSQHQMQLLINAFDASDFDPRTIKRDSSVALSDLAGFLALTTPHANTIRMRLLEHGVHTDCRGDILRLGPAPYLSDAQLQQSMLILRNTI